ncbi:hypothetical protein ABKN59_008220 [Abortiporus biennis]
MIGLKLQTPIKNPMSSAVDEDGKYLDDCIIDSYIRSHFSDVVHRNYPLLDFVRHVWSFDPSSIPRKQYRLSRSDVNGYLQRFSTGKWLESLMQNLQNSLGNSILSTDFNGTFLNLWDLVVEGNYAKQKPDASYTENTAISPDAQTWQSMGMAGEIKNTPNGNMDKERFCINDILIDLLRLEEVPYEYEEPSSSAPSLKRKVSSQAAVNDSSTSKRTKASNTTTSTPSSSTPASKDSPNVTGIKVESDSDHLTNHEVQILKYINELQCHGIRNYSTGMLFERRKVSFWYIDCMGVIKSQPFDFIEEPHYLLLAAAALKAADLAKLGISPFIKFPHRHADDNPVADENVLRFKMDMSDDRDLFNAYGAIGRGTTVFPIRAIQVANNLEKGRTRARTSQKQQESMEALVAKMSWPAERRKSEDGYIRAIIQKLQDNDEGKKYVRNIVEMKYSLTLKMDAEELNFPRGLMKTFKEQSERRIFRVLILKRYEPLERIRSLEEFKKICKELVTAHHWVYTVAEILHRDLSITNMMFLRVGDEVIEILDDWDLAVGKSEEEQKQEKKDLTTTGSNYKTSSAVVPQQAAVITPPVSTNDSKSPV